MQGFPAPIAAPITAPIAALALAVLAALPAAADPAPPRLAAGVTLMDYGIYCQPEIASRESAPDTRLGYVNIFEGEPVFRLRQQEVPALLGMSFGLVVTSDRDHIQARMETWRPDSDAPDIWYTDIAAGERRMRGFSFDVADELVTGLWRLEAWDGAQQLYAIEFDVVPPSRLPGIGPDCNFLSLAPQPGPVPKEPA